MDKSLYVNEELLQFIKEESFNQSFVLIDPLIDQFMNNNGPEELAYLPESDPFHTPLDATPIIGEMKKSNNIVSYGTSPILNLA